MNSAWARASYLVGLEELVSRYAGKDAATLILGPGTLPEGFRTPTHAVPFSLVVQVYDSLLLNIDSFLALFEFNERIGSPWNPLGPGVRFARHARSRSLPEYWARTQSVARMFSNQVEPMTRIVGDTVVHGGPQPALQSLGLSTFAASRNAFRVRQLGSGLSPRLVRLPFKPNAEVARRVERELPGSEVCFEPPMLQWVYDREAWFGAPPIPPMAGPEFTHRDMLLTYIPARWRREAVRVDEIIRRTILEEMREPTLEQVATEAGIDARLLQRALREAGVTLRGVIEMLRVTAAEDLLQDERNSVLDVAVAVGYTSQQALSKTFRRWRGLTPTDYRNRVLALRSPAVAVG